MSVIKVLLVDDDKELCQLLKELLTYEGYEVTSVHEGETGLAMASSNQFALVLLDVMLPRLNGFQLLKQLRQHSAVPVIMLTARGEPADRVLGLEHGADDYLPKPFTEAELIARMKAVLRRYQAAELSLKKPADRFVSGQLSLSLSQQEALYLGDDLGLTSAELAILAELMAHSGKPVDKDHLSEQALGRKLMPFDRSVDMHVSHLRKKLASAGYPAPIKTIRGIGYIWTAETKQA